MNIAFRQIGMITVKTEITQMKINLKTYKLFNHMIKKKKIMKKVIKKIIMNNCKKNSMAQQSMFQKKINMRTCKKPFTHMLQKKMTNKKFTDTHRVPNLPSLPGDRR